VRSSQVLLEAGDTVAVVDPEAGGRLTSLAGRHELLVQYGGDVFHWGSFPMAPWVGRLRHGRLHSDGGVVQLPVNAPPPAPHGLGTDRAWTVTAPMSAPWSSPSRSGRSQPSCGPWPWHCRVTQSVILGPTRIDFRLLMHSEQPMPAGIYLNDAEGMPNGELGAHRRAVGLLLHRADPTADGPLAGPARADRPLRLRSLGSP
jgi:galactose mutarotase-like enzyme